MKQRATLLATLALGTTTSFAGAPTPPTLEYGIEASTDGVTLPGSLPGAIVISGCLSCNRSPMRITAATALMQGSKPLSYPQFNTLAHAGPHFMMIYIVPGKPEITRIVVTADSTAPTR